MTVSITTARLAELTAAGEQNDAIVGIRDVFARVGTFSDGGATAPRMTDGATWTRWVPTGTYPRRATWVLSAGPEPTVNMAGVAGHNCGTLQKQLRLQRWTGTAWEQVGLDVSPATDDPIVWLFVGVPSLQWRITIFDPLATGGDVSIAVAFFGRSLSFGTRMFQGVDEGRDPNQVDLLSNVTGAHVLGTSVIRRGSATQWSLTHVPESVAWSDGARTFYRHFNDGRGFFTAWRPASSQTAAYAFRSGAAIAPVKTGPGSLHSLTLAMRTFVE